MRSTRHVEVVSVVFGQMAPNEMALALVNLVSRHNHILVESHPYPYQLEDVQSSDHQDKEVE